MSSPPTHNRQSLPGVERMLAISSGKGGVGKSTISANLAIALARRGLRIGLVDADVYGPNIPGMLGVTDKPVADRESGRILPVAAYGLKVISMGLLIDPGMPVIWRGPMLTKMMNQFLFNVEWGNIDLLVLDLPPGTGDVQITLTQSAPLNGAVIVTTPSKIALADVRRGVEMFRQSEIPVLGLIENMSYFRCTTCDHSTPIFGSGGGEQLARHFDLPFLGKVPLDNQIRACADAGTPLVDLTPDCPTSKALLRIASELAHSLAQK